jgi:hypothetical protein
VTVARQLDGPHYQATMAKIKASAHPSINFYREDFTSNNFIYVSSVHSEEVNRLLQTIDFKEIGSHLLSRKPAHSVRQSFYEDFGITSGQCTTRKGNPLGIAKPSSKPGSKEKVIQDLLVTCSNVIRALGSSIPRSFQFQEERLLEFAGALATGNMIEAMRLAITDESNLCGVHVDHKNDVNYPSVPVFSKFIFLNAKRYRVSIIMYSRQSISDYLKRKNTTYGPAVSFVLAAYSQIPAGRRSIVPDSFPKSESPSIDCHGLACSNLPCHMDPSFFVSPVIHFGIMLALHHLLDYAELVAVFRAWAAVPYTSYYFCSGIILLLQKKCLPFRGLLLGRFLLIVMKRLLREQHRALNNKIPGLRFGTYRKVVIPEEEKWVASTTEVIRLCLEASFRPDPPGDKKERAGLYEKTRKAVAKEIPNAGFLITNHLMAVLAIVGLVPLWFAGEHTVDTGSKSMKYLVAHQQLVSGKAAAQRFLDTLSSALHGQYGIAATRKYAENVACKAFRLTCTDGSDEKFSDLVFENQCVFQVGDGEVQVHRLGFRKEVVEGPLIHRWSLDGKFWPMPQLLLQFGSMEKGDFHIPRGLGNQGGNHLVPDWVVNIFPRPFIARDGRKARAIVNDLLLL